jgi:asparagine synthase (glutamine-hydrolysing)
MCAIAGIYNFSWPIDKMLDEQVHRGPDASHARAFSLSNGHQFQLGHNRLKIICLSDVANQPFVDETGRYALSFNGEIYNYLALRTQLCKEGIVFNTNSDTEVLLNALIHWGIDALQRLSGMFAFALFDKDEETLWLARDRFGVKPLFYHQSEHHLLFASTSSAIVKALQLQPNLNYVQRGLQYGIYEDGSDETAYVGLKNLKAGHFLKIGFKQKIVYDEYCYYDLAERVKNMQEDLQGATTAQLKDQVLSKLDNACALRLQADVPVALSLSGGLDSSTVAALSRQHANQLEAFCFGAENDKYSEATLAKEISRKHCINTHFIEPEGEAWLDGFWQTLHYQDAPIAGISVVAQYLLYQGIKATGVKVVLGGQGGDEGFLGYRKFQLFHLRELIEKKKWDDALRFFASFSQMLWAERTRWLTFWQIRKRYAKSYNNQTIKFKIAPEPTQMGYSGDLALRQVDDVKHYSLPTLLRYEDRNSMAHSIESRLPFMDFELMELACALPSAMKLHRGYGKWVLRDITEKTVPDSIRLARYKRGFDVSSSKAVYEQLVPSLQAHLTKHRAPLSDVLSSVPSHNYFSVDEMQTQANRFNELQALCWLGDKL